MQLIHQHFRRIVECTQFVDLLASRLGIGTDGLAQWRPAALCFCWAHFSLSGHSCYAPRLFLPARVLSTLKHSSCIKVYRLTHKHRKSGVMDPQAQYLRARVVDHANSLENQLQLQLQLHRANSSSLLHKTHRQIALVQGVLTHQAKQTHHHSSQCEHKFVSIILAGAKPTSHCHA